MGPSEASSRELAAGREDEGKDGGMDGFVEYTPSQAD